MQWGTTPTVCDCRDAPRSHPPLAIPLLLPTCSEVPAESWRVNQKTLSSPVKTAHGFPLPHKGTEVQREEAMAQVTLPVSNSVPQKPGSRPFPQGCGIDGTTLGDSVYIEYSARGGLGRLLHCPAPEGWVAVAGDTGDFRMSSATPPRVAVYSTVNNKVNNIKIIL